MSAFDIPPTLSSLTIDQQVEWMLSMGEFLTISARNSYPGVDGLGNIDGVIGHNEIQHRLFARVRDLRAGREWTLENFVRMISEAAESYKIANDVGWAFEKSLQTLTPNKGE